MVETIKRKLVENTVFSYSIENGRDSPTLVSLEPITVYGKITEKEAVKILKEKFPDKETIHLVKIESKETHLEIKIEDFIRYAKPIQSK